METALEKIVAPETVSNVAVSVGAMRGVAQCARWNISVSCLRLRDVIPARQDNQEPQIFVSANLCPQGQEGQNDRPDVGRDQMRLLQAT
jgi:hypothetical protein